MNTELINKAITFATKKHETQIRRSTGVPYIFHPFEVASIATTITTDENTICATLLHDTLEDTDTTYSELEQEFGSRIAKLVASESENPHSEMSAKESWQIRKEESLAKLAACTDREVKVMWLSDKLSNMRSFYRLYLQKGEQMWQMFDQTDHSKQKWLYSEIAKFLQELSDTVAYKEYMFLYNKIFH